MIISIEFNHSIHIHNLKNGNKFGIRFGNLFRSISFSFFLCFVFVFLSRNTSFIHNDQQSINEKKKEREHDDDHHRPNDISSYWQ